MGKTTRPFRYDLNQIPYDYTVEVRNRYKGLDLTDRVPDELWTEVADIVQETVIKTVLKEKKCKKEKWLSEEALQIAVKGREVKSTGEKERYTQLNAEFQRIARSFPGGSNGKESDCNAGDLGLIPGFGRSPGEGHSNALQYCLENPHGQRGLAGYIPSGRKESDPTE